MNFKNKLSNKQRLNFERNLNDAINLFPQLMIGLDINVKFSEYVINSLFFLYLTIWLMIKLSVNAFEFTKECLLFDLFDMNLYHVWNMNCIYK